MIDIYFLSPSVVQHADELRKNNKILTTIELGQYTAFVVVTNRRHGYFYVDMGRVGISRAIQDNHSDLLIKLERQLMSKLECKHDTGDLAFHNCGMSFMVLTSPLAKEPVLFLEYQITSPDFYYSLL